MTENAGAKVVEVDFTSVESLTTALRGIDALVSTVSMMAIDSQTILIDAAVAAGVKRFIPSEYGSVSSNPKLENNPAYAGMWKVKRYLWEKAKTGDLTWTVLATGAFLEFLFGHSMLLDFENHKATLYDEGDNRISSTSMANIGKAIASILKNYEATKNKVMRVSETILTQNQVLKMAKDLRPDVNWEVSKTQTSAMLREGLDEIAAEGFSMPVMMKIVGGTALAGDIYGGAYDETDNQLLGVQELTEEDLKRLVAEKLS